MNESLQALLALFMVAAVFTIFFTLVFSIIL